MNGNKAKKLRQEILFLAAIFHAALGVSARDGRKCRGKCQKQYADGMNSIFIGTERLVLLRVGVGLDVEAHFVSLVLQLDVEGDHHQHDGDGEGKGHDNQHVLQRVEAARREERPRQ